MSLWFAPLAFLIAVYAIRNERTRQPRWVWPVAILFGLVFAVHVVRSPQEDKYWACDLRIYYKAGSLLWAHGDPYTVTGLKPPNDKIIAIPYPPTAFPLFAVFALAPQRTASLAWAGVNAMLLLGLGLQARRVLDAQDRGQPAAVSPALAAVLRRRSYCRVLPISSSTQARSRCSSSRAVRGPGSPGTNPRTRPAIAGLGLAVATIKFATSLPFLLLFLRRSDHRIWLFFILFGAALTFTAVNPIDLPKKITAMQAAISVSREPGRVNDYSSLNAQSATMVGIDQALSRIGVADRRIIDVLTRAILLALGVWLAYTVIFKAGVPRGQSSSLLSIYSTLFVYHRTYDLPILILPFLYCTAGFGRTRGTAHWCYAWVIVAIFIAVNLHTKLVLQMHYWPESWAFVKAVVMPCPTYSLLSSLAALAVATRLEFAPGQMEAGGATLSSKPDKLEKAALL